MSHFTKVYSRLNIVLSGGIFRIFVSFANLIISLFVIRTQSDQLWGQMVYYLMILDFGFSVVNWGHVPYLIQIFSSNPSGIRRQVMAALQSRFYLLFIFSAVVLVSPLPVNIKGMIVLCALARFVYQSFDPVAQYERKFIFSIVCELIGLCIVVAPMVIYGYGISLDLLLKLYSISFVIRALLALVYYRRYIFPFQPIPIFDWRVYLKPAFPFFLLTITALFQQRTDLYVVNLILAPEDSARYQTFLNLLLFSQVGASLLLSPFARSIFRLPPESLQKLERHFIRSGFILAMVSTSLIYLVLTFIFRFNLSWRMYLMAYVYIVLYYTYHIQNYRLQRSYAQSTVALYSMTGVFVNLCSSFVLIPRFGIEGAAAAGLATQALITVLHYKGTALIGRVTNKVSRLPA